MSTTCGDLMGSKVKKKHLKPKHQKAKVFRASEPLLSVFMWGVNHTINGLTHVNIPVMLLPEDFKAFSKIKVDNHYFNKENMPSHFKVKEYCPLVFRNLRERFGIDDRSYINSLTKSQPVPVDKSLRSGTKLYESYDKKFVIKVLQREEVEQMHVLLKQYHPYIVEKHGNSLLPQYLGLYRLTVEGAETYVAVMRNIFSSFFRVHCKYDLKGSTVDREASDKEKETKTVKRRFKLIRDDLLKPDLTFTNCYNSKVFGPFPELSEVKDLPTLKDNDFVRDGCKLYLGKDCKDKLLSTLKADVEFLSKLNLVDYSLCLGIHDIDKAEEEELQAQEREKGAIEADGSGGENEQITEEEEDSAGSGVGKGTIPSPPDSPKVIKTDDSQLPNGVKDPSKDFYAIFSDKSAPRRLIYYIALVDVLTHYGVKKRTAQAAKTVKHGAGAEISTVHPDQYAKRLLDFVSKAIL